MESKFSSVLIRVKNWQNLYGVKRGNYKAYKNFTNRRSKKIRKRLGINFGRKFNKDKFLNLFLNPKDLKDYEPKRINLIVESLLLIVEKNYINYAESKIQTSNIKKKIVKKKLRKALKLIKSIQKVFNDFLNQRMLLELKVYQAMIESALYLEKKKYKEAKEKSMFLIGTLKQLSELLSAIEKAQIEELIQSAEQNLRYCKFQLREFDNDEEKDTLLIMDKEDISKMLMDIEKENGNITDKKCKINVFGRDLEIDDMKLIGIIEKDKILKKSYENNEDKNTKEELFWEIVNNFEEGIKICHGYKIDAGNNANLAEIWDSIDDFFTYNKTIYILQKNIFIYFNLLTNSKKIILPQNFIKISELILSSLRKLIDLTSKYNYVNNLFSYLEMFFRIKKCFGISNLYYNNKCYLYCLSLNELQKEKINLLEENSRKNLTSINSEIKNFDENYKVNKNLSVTKIFEYTLSETTKLKNNFIVLSKQSKMALYDKQQINMESLKFDINYLDVNNQKFDKAGNVNCLLDLVLENRKINSEERMDFVKIPPLSVLIPTKPINLDLVGDFVSYPDVDFEGLGEKKKVVEKKGFFSKLWGS